MEMSKWTHVHFVEIEVTKTFFWIRHYANLISIRMVGSLCSPRHLLPLWMLWPSYSHELLCCRDVSSKLTLLALLDFWFFHGTEKFRTEKFRTEKFRTEKLRTEKFRTTRPGTEKCRTQMLRTVKFRAEKSGTEKFIFHWTVKSGTEGVDWKIQDSNLPQPFEAI